MTKVEHITAWIGASVPHCDRINYLLSKRDCEWQRSDNKADHALQIVMSAYREMIAYGDAVADDFTPVDLLQAAIAIALWEEKP